MTGAAWPVTAIAAVLGPIGWELLHRLRKRQGEAR